MAETNPTIPTVPSQPLPIDAPELWCDEADDLSTMTFRHSSALSGCPRSQPIISGNINVLDREKAIRTKSTKSWELWRRC